MAKKDEKITEGEIVNEEPKKAKKEKAEVTQKVSKNTDRSLFVGFIFVLIGSLVFINNFFPEFEVAKFFWPIVLIFFGFALIFRSF